jgi:hypothetical protein
MRREGYVSRIGDMRNASRILVGKAKGMRPFGRHMGDNVRMEVRVIGCEGVDWIHLATFEFHKMWKIS